MRAASDTPTDESQPAAKAPRWLLPAVLILLAGILIIGLSYAAAKRAASAEVALAVAPLSKAIAAQYRAAARSDSLARVRYLSVSDSLSKFRERVRRQQSAQAFETYKLNLINADLEKQVDSLNRTLGIRPEF